MGVNVDLIYTSTFAIGSSLAAAAGALLGPVYVIFPQMGDLAAVKAFAIVILGGLGNITGAVIGGFILALAEELGAGYVSSGIPRRHGLSDHHRGPDLQADRTFRALGARRMRAAVAILDGRRIRFSSAVAARSLSHECADHDRHLHHRRDEPQSAARVHRPAQPRSHRILRHRRLCQRIDVAWLRCRPAVRHSHRSRSLAADRRLRVGHHRCGVMRISRGAAVVSGARRLFRDRDDFLCGSGPAGRAELGRTDARPAGADQHSFDYGRIAGSRRSHPPHQAAELLPRAISRGCHLSPDLAPGPFAFRPGHARADGKRNAGGIGRHRRDEDAHGGGGDLGRDCRRGRQPLRALHPDHRSRSVRLHQYRDDGDHGHHWRQGVACRARRRRHDLRAVARVPAPDHGAGGAMDRLWRRADRHPVRPAARHRAVARATVCEAADADRRNVLRLRLPNAMPRSTRDDTRPP